MIFSGFFFLCHRGSQLPKTAEAASQCQQDGQTEHGEKADRWAHSQVHILHTAVHPLCGIKKDNSKQNKTNLAAFPALGPWMSGSVSQVRAAIPVDAATDSGSDSSLALHKPRFLFLWG